MLIIRQICVIYNVQIWDFYFITSVSLSLLYLTCFNSVLLFQNLWKKNHRKRITKALSGMNQKHLILILILQSFKFQVVIISTTEPTRDFRKKRNDLPCILSLLFHLSLNLFLHNRWSQEKYKNTEKHEVVRIISCFTDAIQ